MIEINLLPGAGRKARGRGASAAGLGTALSGLAAKVKDPHLIFAVATTAVCLAAIGLLQWRQTAEASTLAEAELQAVNDSARYAAQIKEKRSAEARRDSVMRQLSIIKAIDNNRFVWPHLMDEVSRVMPPYTWLTQMTQTSTTPVPAAEAPQESGAKGAKGAKAPADSLDAPPPAMKFRIVGITVDIQALTRFMKDLEASAFIRNVSLDKSSLAVVEGQEVTEFQLSAEYETPDTSAIRQQPVALSVR